MGLLDSLCPIEKPQFAIGDKVKYKDDFRDAKYGEGVITGYHDEQIICKFKKSDCHHYFSHRKFKSELDTYKVKTFAEKPDRNRLYVPKGFYCGDFLIGKIINVRNGEIARCTEEKEKIAIFRNKTTEYCFNKAYFDQACIQVAEGNCVKLNECYYQWFLDYSDGAVFENKFKVVSTKFNWYKLSVRCFGFDSEPYSRYVDFWLPSCLFRVMTYDEFCGIPQLIHENNAKLVEQVDPTEELVYFFPEYFVKEKNNMTKDDLKTGMVIETRECLKYVVLKNNEGKLFGMANSQFIGSFCGYNDDMTFTTNRNIDICKVYEIKNAGSFNGYASVLEKNNLTLLWKRNETKEIPMSEVMDILADKLGCEKNDIKITS